MKTLLRLIALIAVPISLFLQDSIAYVEFYGDPVAGYETLLNDTMAVSPGLGTMTEEEWDNLWLVFPEDLKQKIRSNPSLKQEITLERYGFNLAPEIDPKRPVGFFTRKDNDKWEMNCLICHGGTIPSPEGPKFYMGAPNSNLDLVTFIEDRIKLFETYRSKSSFTLQDGLLMKSYKKQLREQPVNSSRGAYSVWQGGDIFLALRTREMRTDPVNFVRAFLSKPKLFGNRAADMDPPTWWNTKYRERLWIDGFAPKEPRMNALQIMPMGNPLRKMDQQFVDVLEYINQVDAPRYPFSIVREKASRGKVVYDKSCSKCHGTYDSTVNYPNKTIPLDVIGTDPVRLEQGMTSAYRQFAKDSWVGRFGKADIRVEPEGYMPPPLTGIWASAPYFHNGSVPTLYHVLFPDQRPAIWKANRLVFNQAQVGYTFEVADSAVVDLMPFSNEKRFFFDTRMNGKSNEGHLFPEKLTVTERMDVLEYLKTL
jgi:mono/diheme cytochrome c family protein